MNSSEEFCEKCDKNKWVFKCGCGMPYCEPCFNTRPIRHKTHRQAGSRKTEEWWAKASGLYLNLSNFQSREKCFKEDEGAKWFGLRSGGTIFTETKRLSHLMELSTTFTQDSPQRQFPSITSFIGETNAGKSTLIRSLIFLSEKHTKFNPLEAPVPAARTGDSVTLSTTGEVNLYLDPETFGTESPILYADCEGMLGTEPTAAKHQREWASNGRHYTVIKRGDAAMDRSTAVNEVYPRFLYIFSDVVCFVVRNHKAWADSALKLLSWSMTGAQSAINQHALPALIIILNGPNVEDKSWISSDSQDSVTRSFFSAIEKEITENSTMRDYASRFKVSTMKELFEKSFSSVYVHYVPLQSYLELGTTDIMEQQNARLAERIQDDSSRVQQSRQRSWTRFDVRELSLIMDFAFTHFAARKSEPFDFDKCRKKLSIPTTLMDHFASFFQHCLGENMMERLEATAAVLSSSILLNSHRSQGRDLLQHPDFIFTRDTREVCSKAADHFLVTDRVCGFVDAISGDRCVNSFWGHVLGHQSKTGILLGDGPFIKCQFDKPRFFRKLDEALQATMRLISTEQVTDTESCRRLVAAKHRSHLANIRELGGYPSWDPSAAVVRKDFFSPKICFGCLYGKPELILPCSHIICTDCLTDFDSLSAEQRYPGNYSHESCMICEAGDAHGWPFSIQNRPHLANFRVLSLDGGGVRGIVELTLLKRLEDHIGLDVPLGRFFDLILGTSAVQLMHKEGGMIAIGLGIQQRTVSDCIDLFRAICDKGFESKPGTTIPYTGIFARMLHSSMYKTTKFEEAAREAFGAQPSEMFGRTNSIRVAVTTTLDNAVPKLIANYNLGGSGRYLESDLSLWQAARCTSAAPMYFKPMSHHYQNCYDGGLKMNNPVQDALIECRDLWGEQVDFDLILSVGSGRADSPPDCPAIFVPNRQWWKPLLATFFNNLNGEAAWGYYIKSQLSRTREVSCRLNVKFEAKEPALDAVKQIDYMERTAEYAKLSLQDQNTEFSTKLSSISYEDDLLVVLADKIRASMFFFQLDSMTEVQANVVYKFDGWIGCQFEPYEKALRLLLSVVHRFMVDEGEVLAKEVPLDEPFRLPISFLKQKRQPVINITVDFGKERTVPISGFPMDLERLRRYWEDNKDSLQRAVPETPTAQGPLVLRQG